MKNNITQELLEINQELLNFTDNTCKPTIIEQENQFAIIAIFIFAKSIKSFRALNLLCENGYGEDAAILARSLLENLINLSYLKKEDSQDRSRLFAFYSFFDGKKKLGSILNRMEETKSPLLDEIKEKINAKDFEENFKIAKEMLEKEFNRIKQNTSYSPKNNQWSCLSIKDMAIETNLYDPYYIEIYWLNSQLSHPSASSAKNYLEYGQKELNVTNTPSHRWVEESLVLGFDCVIKIAYLISEIFKLDCESKIKLLEEKYLKICK